MRVRFEEGAVSDLRSIFEHISLDKPTAAGKLVEHIEYVASLLGEQPGMGHKTKLPSLKTFPVGKYLIVYEIANDEVIIQYVRHGARRQRWEG